MLQTKNSDPNRCAENLLAIVRGEVPYDRIRGLNAKIIDTPVGNAVDELKDDAEWVLTTYEPRLEVDAVTVTADDETGALKTSVKFK